jgi:DNA-binding transcriptional regulator/RsmH inhibitor MraZ
MVEFKQLDTNNRISISNKYRKKMGLDQDTLLKVEMKDGAIVITPVEVVAKPVKE